MSNYYKTAEDFDWYKFYPASFSVTTAHLSHVELGIYRRILDHYWASDNKLPRNAAEIAERIGEKVFNWRRYGITAPAGFDNEEVTIKVVEHLLSEFFEQDEDDDWRHPWLDEYRQAADSQFKERSKVSKERAARQPRGSKGKFGKIITVTDGESPCLTAEITVPDGKVTVEQSTYTVPEDQKDQKDQSKRSKGTDVASTLAEENLPTVSNSPEARELTDREQWEARHSYPTKKAA